MEEVHKLIEELYDFTLTDLNNTYKIVDLWNIETGLAQKIFKETGVDVEGFSVAIDNYGISHTMLNHGNPLKEALRGQIAVSKSDFNKIIDVLQQADSIRLDIKTFKNNVTKETLVFVKEFDDRYFVAKEIRRVTKKGKRNRLVLQTLYILKKNK
jgi:phage-Barnase-EndoU-ColicinE5/D-RelE like nuclease3